MKRADEYGLRVRIARQVAGCLIIKAQIPPVFIQKWGESPRYNARLQGKNTIERESIENRTETVENRSGAAACKNFDQAILFYKVGENVIAKTDITNDKVMKMCHGGAYGNEVNESRRRKEQKCGSGGERVRSEGVFGTAREEKRAVSEAESGRNGAATGEGALAQLFSSFFVFRSCNRSLKMIY